MAICLNCGKETKGYLCDECRQIVDLEELISKISVYTPMMIDNPNTNPVWEEAALEMEHPVNFRNVAFDLADGLQSPRKEYQKILSLTGKNIRVPRDSKPWFYEAYEQIIQMDSLEDEEKLKLKGLMLEALYQDYRYSEADKLTSELLEEEKLPWETIYRPVREK